MRDETGSGDHQQRRQRRRGERTHGTTGGFLQVGNTTLLIGTEDDRVAELVGILKKYCATHKKVVPTTESFGRGLRKDGVAPEITVGGATYFVLDVADMGKL